MKNIFSTSGICFTLLLAVLIASPSVGFAQDAAAVMQNTDSMEKALTAVKQHYQADPKKGQAAVQALTQSQEQWKSSTVNACKAGGPAKMNECMNARVLSRTSALNAMLKAP